MPLPDRSTGRFRGVVPIAALLAGAVLATLTLSGLLHDRDDTAAASVSAVPQVGKRSLNAVIYATQDKLRRLPDDAPTWAQLGTAYVEQARITADPLFYAKAEGALEKSLQVAPHGNAPAMIGMGQLANARHDFAAGRHWAEQARALQPSTAEVYGVLADALTQLGNAQGATAAIQSMLDLRPGIPSFTRASFDLELHGRVEQARSALQRALDAAATPDDVGYCRYYLGELAFSNGRVDEAAQHYEQGLLAVPGNVALLQGRAKVAAATGRVSDALAGYAQITSRVPSPQYVLEYGELLEAVGRVSQAREQYALLAAQQQLYAAQGFVDDLFAAQVATDHGDPAAALASAQREWHRRQSVFSADGLAWALHANGRDAEALSFADQALVLGWRNATFAYHRGMILKSLGRAADAHAALSQALAINPHFSPLAAPRARQALAELAAAHPLGNFTVNHYDGLRLFPDRIELHAVLDTAEIPTLQEKAATDTDGDGAISPSEADRHAGAECAAVAGAVAATVNGSPVRWRVEQSAVTYPPGQPPLPTTRVSCVLVAPADLRAPATVQFTDGFRADRLGWREITAVGHGLRVVSSTVGTTSISDELRRYPEDLLSNPRDERSATVRVEPGTGDSAAGAPPTTKVGWLDRGLASATSTFNELAGGPDLTPLVGIAAALLALLLGASHAALPGHGKTVMAAYLAGRQGTRRDALLVGVTVTLTHTAGVLVLGLLIAVLSSFAPEAALRWLGVLSGLLVALIGAGLLRSAVRQRSAVGVPCTANRAPALIGAPVHHGSDYHGHDHSHAYRPGGAAGLVGMGIAGGLVPSPTALFVLLGAIGLGRSWFGVALVLCYGLGMAGTLTLAGLLLVMVRDRLVRSGAGERLTDRGRRVAAVLPAVTAVLVLVVGLGLALRSLLGPG